MRDAIEHVAGSRRLSRLPRAVWASIARGLSLLRIWDDTDELYPRNPDDQTGIAQAATSYRLPGNVSGF